MDLRANLSPFFFPVGTALGPTGKGCVVFSEKSPEKGLTGLPEKNIFAQTDASAFGNILKVREI
jgi:hypothetical protein